VDLRLTLNGEELAGELYDNPVAEDLAARLPVRITLADFNGVEKVGRLDRPLRVSGVPSSDAPSPGEIGYYAPGSAFVLYYGEVGRWPGLVRIGRFTADLAWLAALPDGIDAHVARAEA
jgi:hypothetical protein